MSKPGSVSEPLCEALGIRPPRDQAGPWASAWAPVRPTGPQQLRMAVAPRLDRAIACAAIVRRSIEGSEQAKWGPFAKVVAISQRLLDGADAVKERNHRSHGG